MLLRLPFALDDFAELFDFADFFVELFFAVALLEDRLFEDFFEGAASADVPSAPKQTIAASGSANLIILSTHNNRKGVMGRSGVDPIFDRLWRQAFDNPAGAPVGTAVAEAVVQAIRSALPEFEPLRHDTITTPMRRQRNRTTRILLGHVRERNF